MEKISFKNIDFLYKRKKRTANKIWIKAKELANLTHTEPKRWLREVSQNQWAIDRALIDYNEANAKGIGLFYYLLKKYKRA